MVVKEKLVEEDLVMEVNEEEEVLEDVVIRVE